MKENKFVLKKTDVKSKIKYNMNYCFALLILERRFFLHVYFHISFITVLKKNILIIHISFIKETKIY